MGGIPTNEYGEVQDDAQQVVTGLYAVGECAAASFHGFNRLGTNSILELITMGKVVAERVIEYLASQPGEWPESSGQRYEMHFSRYLDAKKADSIGELRERLRATMTEKVGVFRTEASLTEAGSILKDVNDRAEHTALAGRSLTMNQELVQRWELDNLLAVSMAICRAALERRESRGGHFRDDYPERKDEFNYHTLVTMPRFGKIELGQRQVDMSVFRAGGENHQKFDYIERKY
jgi:succinate dehydrogenase / fumarate reductase flavoprotein subunit